jgi:hypothetical protein
MLNNHLLESLHYTYPVERLRWGHAYGNRYAYVTLDPKTDVMAEMRTVRKGLRESTNQRYYLIEWDVNAIGESGQPFVPVTTTFTPAYQETQLENDGTHAYKQFFLPFENNELRAAHFLLGSDGGARGIQSRLVFPAGAGVSEADYKGHRYLRMDYADGSTGLVWGSSPLTAFTSREVADGQIEAHLEWTWPPDAPEFGLSFVYNLQNPNPALNALFDILTHAPGLDVHIERLKLVLSETHLAFDRYLQTSRLWTPDAVLNRAVHWSKVNQLRDQQAYKLGQGFSNNPPSDIVVGRDSIWYLCGSSYYAQPWSRKLLDFWFAYGLESSGKFTEYITAAREPLWKDDYGLNINDNTPLFIVAAHQYFALTGDQGFLDAVYPRLVHTANYILSQRDAGGEANPYSLVWCTTTEKLVRGLCTWRNCIVGYTLSGAVTEVNAQCYRALLLMAELAETVGDERNRERFQAAADDLREAIEKHLRCSTPLNPYYYLTIDTEGRPRDNLTADLLFPVLYGVSDDETAAGILHELFGEHFWVSREGGGGGMRTVSATDPEFQPKAEIANYGLLGGVWPNLALWVARAAAERGFPDLALKALRETFLLSEPDDPARHHVVPGEMPEFFNGDDLFQRAQPRSTFLFGILVWAAVESFLGLSPHAKTLRVKPALPQGWTWAAISNLPHRGYPLSMLAVETENEQTLYTTAQVDTDWKQVIAPAVIQQQYRFKPDGQVFWLVLPETGEVIAAAADAVEGQLVERRSGRVAANLNLQAGEITRVKLS